MSGGVVKWDDLRVFLEVARQGTVHAAAKKLKLDHSTVCRRIGKLEDLLAIKLLDRSQRGIVVRGGVQQLLDHIESMETHAISIEDALTGSLTSSPRRPGASPPWRALPASIWRGGSALLDRFAPNVKVEAGQHAAAGDLSRKEADIFLSFFNPRLPGLSSRKVADVALFSTARRPTRGCTGCRAASTSSRIMCSSPTSTTCWRSTAVRWLDDLISRPKVSFYSNSILAQCNAATAARASPCCRRSSPPACPA